MDYIAHRINTIKQLKLLDNKYGIEIDIRDDGKDLIIVHDPFKKGIKLEKFLKSYNHKIIIANIKSERIEDRVIKVFKEHRIYNYFFLDTSIPKIIELVKRKFETQDYEDYYLEAIEDMLQSFYNFFNWIWFDRRKQKQVIRIDKHDTWSMDSTLAPIILAMLKQLQEFLIIR